MSLFLIGSPFSVYEIPYKSAHLHQIGQIEVCVLFSKQKFSYNSVTFTSYQVGFNCT